MKRWIGLLTALFLATAAHTFFSASLAALGAPAQNFDGLGSGFTGPGGTMTVDTAPPDPSGDVGPNHYVQAVNAQLAVFNKSGIPVLGPVALNSLWAGFGGDCETNNDGHPNVLYDQLADRWVISQVSLTGADGTTRPYQVCVAVSTTPDPTGSYARYAFPTSVPPLSPTLSMWPDSYYLTFDIVSAAAAGGSVVCAYDRAQMLSGQPATEQCLSGGAKGVLPVDLDGDVAPAAGNAAYLLALGGDQQSVELRTFKVDWATPANSTVSDPQVLPVTPWLDPSSPSIPQSGGGLLDPVAGRLMRRVTYRALGDGGGAVLADHTVLNGASAGIRWYEIAIPGPLVNALPTVTQEGTFSPDADHRWVGAVAMDDAGNIGLGYSASSPSLKPELRYTAHLNADPAGTMTQGEGTIIAGAGAQDASVATWGRDSSMTVDPADGCTFWFTGEYLPVDGTLNWRTRIATFTLPGCATLAPDFTIGVSPASQTITTGSSANYSITTTALNGSAQQIALSVSGLPAGVSATIAPATVTAGGSSTLTISAPLLASASTSTFTVTGTPSSGVAHTANADATVVVGTVITPLVNGIPVTGLSGAINSSRYFVLNVPAGQGSLTFSMSGGTGDADMYLRFGSLPTTTTYYCRPYLTGNSETCTVTNPQAGDWFVMLLGYAAYSNVSIKGTYAPAATYNTLTNNVPVSNLSGAAASKQIWKMTVPAGQATLSFRIFGGTGDVDLYVRFGSPPTTSTYNCRPYINGNSEICTFTNPQAGDWYVMLRGYAAYSGVTLVGSYATDTTTLLQNGVPITGISGATGSQQFWKIAVPAGRPNLHVAISGGTGDADLYVRFGSKPTTSTWTCRPYLAGNSESCFITNPQAGDWFVMLRGYTAFSGVTLKGNY